MDDDTFYRGVLLALCEKGRPKFPADGDTFHKAFRAMLEYAVTVAPALPVKHMMRNYDPIFGVHRDATAMVLEGERGFILSLDNPRLRTACFKLAKEDASAELSEMPEAKIFRELAARLDECLAS